MFAEDLSVFFNPGEHAHVATRELEGGKVESVPVIFDRPDALFVGEMVQAAQPEMLYPAEFFAGLAHGGQVEIDAVRWQVVSEPEHVEDGRLMKATLKKVTP